MSGRLKKFIGEEPLKSSVTADGVVEVSDKAKQLIPWLVATAFFMQMLDGTILNTALPSIARSLGESPLRMQSVVISYLLTVAVLIPASGWLADRFGIRRIFLCAVAIFSLGSIFCALSQTLTGLVMGRIVQGVGGAVMTPVGRLAILRITPRKDLVRVMSFIAIPGLIGPLLGPTMGGLLVEYASWHWIFILNIPVGALGIYLTLRHMPPLILGEVFKFDWAGFLLLAVMMVTCSIGLEGVGHLGIGTTIYYSLFAVAALALTAYIFHARRSAHPLFDLNIFKNNSFRTGIAGNIAARLGDGAMPFLMPLFLQIGLNLSPARAGLTMIPMPLGALISRLLVARVVRRFGYRNMLLANTTLLGLLIISFSQIRHYDNYYLMLLHLGLFGLVNSTQFVIMTTSTLVNLDAREASTGNSIISVIMQLTQSMGVSVGALALTFFISYTTAGQTPADQGILQAFGYTFAAMGLATMGASLIFSRMPKNMGRDAAPPPRRSKGA